MKISHSKVFLNGLFSARRLYSDFSIDDVLDESARYKAERPNERIGKLLSFSACVLAGVFL